MAGDPLRDAVRALLATVKAEQSIAWTTKDTLNTTEDPDVSAPYLELEFPGGAEEQGSFGAPGQNIHDELGQFAIRICVPLGSQQAQAEIYARKLRNGFRARFFQTSEGRDVAIDAVTPAGGGEIEGGLWVESILLSYSTTNLG